jgi:Ca2+-binding RTX toxin-like protein
VTDATAPVIGGIVWVGTPLDDVRYGGLYDDRLSGLGGDDDLRGRGGNDVIKGGDGADLVIGRAGDDRLFGNADDDLVRGGDGNDELSGGKGRDFLNGGHGDDTLKGGPGRDIFVFRRLSGEDRIVDFDPQKDRIDLPERFDFSLRQVGLDVELELEGQVLTIDGVALTDLDPPGIFI